MITTLSTNEVVNILLADEYAHWTYEGARALAEWLEELEEGMDEPLALDPIALRCQFNEYSSIGEVEDAYAIHPDVDSLEWLNDRTIVIEFESGLIVGEF